jgi:cytochrome d ubiquinol oxidase subunit II
MSAAVPFLDNQIATRWFSMPNLLYLSPVPLLTAAAAFALWRSARRAGNALPFVLAMALFSLGYAGLAISL